MTRCEWINTRGERWEESDQNWWSNNFFFKRQRFSEKVKPFGLALGILEIWYVPKMRSFYNYYPSVPLGVLTDLSFNPIATCRQIANWQSWTKVRKIDLWSFHQGQEQYVCSWISYECKPWHFQWCWLEEAARMQIKKRRSDEIMAELFTICWVNVTEMSSSLTCAASESGQSLSQGKGTSLREMDVK